MRRNVARIGVVAAIALSMSVATMTAPSTRAEDAPSLVAPARSSAGLMNYAINLSQLSDENAMARVIELLPSVGGTLLTQYPGLHTVFAQSESASFSPDLNAVLREHGIAVHSIGPTRVAAVPESERVTNQTPPAAPGSAPAAAPTGLTVPDPNVPDPFPTTNWGAEAMDARGAAEVEVPRAPFTVGVIDTGIDAEQPDLAGRVDTSRSVSCDVNGIPNVSEEALRYNDIHGTHIAGIIAANHNDIGIDGIAPDATLVSIKAVNDKGRLYPEYLVCAYDWAVNHGVDIVHNSFQMDPWRFWKSDDPEQAAGLEAAVRAIYTAQERGLTVLSGAGDDGLDLDDTTVDSSSPTDSTPIENRNVEGGHDGARDGRGRRHGECARDGDSGRGAAPGDFEENGHLQLWLHARRFCCAWAGHLLDVPEPDDPFELRVYVGDGGCCRAREWRRRARQVDPPRAGGRADHQPDAQAGGLRVREARAADG